MTYSILPYSASFNGQLGGKGLHLSAEQVLLNIEIGHSFIFYQPMPVREGPSLSVRASTLCEDGPRCSTQYFLVGLCRGPCLRATARWTNGLTWYKVASYEPVPSYLRNIFFGLSYAPQPVEGSLLQDVHSAAK